MQYWKILLYSQSENASKRQRKVLLLWPRVRREITPKTRNNCCPKRESRLRIRYSHTQYLMAVLCNTKLKTLKIYRDLGVKASRCEDQIENVRKKTSKTREPNVPYRIPYTVYSIQLNLYSKFVTCLLNIRLSRRLSSRSHSKNVAAQRQRGRRAGWAVFARGDTIASSSTPRYIAIDFANYS